MPGKLLQGMRFWVAEHLVKRRVRKQEHLITLSSRIIRTDMPMNYPSSIRPDKTVAITYPYLTPKQDTFRLTTLLRQTIRQYMYRSQM